MKKLIPLILSLIALFAVAVVVSHRRNRPNLAFIIIDCWRYDYFSREITPNIYRLSQEGTVFANYYVNTGYTRASMATIFSSQHPQFEPDDSWSFAHQTGLRRFHAGSPVVNEEGCEMFPEELTSFPEIMKDAGYTTIAIATNAHVGRCGGYGPKQWSRLVEFTSENRYAANAITEAIKEIRSAQEPYLLYLHLSDMHCPYDIGNVDGETLRLLEDYQKTKSDNVAVGIYRDEASALARRRELLPLALRTYSDAGQYTDTELARLFDEMDKNNTVIIISADHGEMFSATDIKGIEHYGFLSKEIVHVPLIIAGKGVHAGLRTELTHSVDIFPTILKLDGLQAPENVRGKNLFSRKRPMKETFASTSRENARITLNAVIRTPVKRPPTNEELVKSLKTLGYLN